MMSDTTLVLVIVLGVGLIIVMPLVISLARKTGKPILYYGMPLLAGLAVAHSFIPPTPGPIAFAELLGEDLGWVILFGTIAGIPAMAIAGPFFGRYIAKKITVGLPAGSALMKDAKTTEKKHLPSFGVTLGLLLVPLVLILMSSVAGVTFDTSSIGVQFIMLIGHPFVALLIVVLLSFRILGRFKGYSRQQIQDIATKALEPAGIIILLTGAGGAFKHILIDSGLGQMLGNHMASSVFSPILMAFIVAAVIRVAQGSATVAMITAGGIMFPINEALGLDGPILSLMVIAIAAGATIASHVNDSGFWMVNRFFGLTVKDTLKSWT